MRIGIGDRIELNGFIAKAFPYRALSPAAIPNRNTPRGGIQMRRPKQQRLLSNQGKRVSKTCERIGQILRDTHKDTMLLRRFKDKTYLDYLDPNGDLAVFFYAVRFNPQA